MRQRNKTCTKNKNISITGKSAGRELVFIVYAKKIKLKPRIYLRISKIPTNYKLSN